MTSQEKKYSWPCKNSLNNLILKYKKAKYKLKEKFSKSIWQERSHELADVISDDEETANNDHLSNELEDMISIYNRSDNIMLLSILQGWKFSIIIRKQPL